MLPSWERILYFHMLPAVIDGLLALAGILLLLKLFRVRNHSLRTLLLFTPLVRPLFIFLEGVALRDTLERRQFPNMQLGFRLPDPLGLVPLDTLGHEQLSTVSRLIAILTLLALLSATGFLAYRWGGFVLFYRRLRRRSEKAATDSKLALAVGELSQQMGLKNPPDILLLSGRWATPCAIGHRHPALVIDPDLLEDFSQKEVRAILAHELAHIRRRDIAWHWASVLLRDIQSFNPFSHLSMSQISLEREKGCDHLALQTAGVSPQFLAECLVKTARQMLEKQRQPLPGYGMSFFRGEHRALRKRLDFLLSLPESLTTAPPRGKTFTGRLKMAVMLVFFIPLCLMQIYVGVWIGSFPLVIK